MEGLGLQAAIIMLQSRKLKISLIYNFFILEDDAYLIETWVIVNEAHAG